jgi:sec-independent protein translocase protein TatA
MEETKRNGRQMALAGWEWIVIAGVIIIFFLWGPKKIPDLARAIGRARGEFEKASKEEPESVGVKPAPTSADNALIDTARKLGISTEGKTIDEIAREIALRASTSKTAGSTA